MDQAYLRALVIVWETNWIVSEDAAVMAFGMSAAYVMERALSLAPATVMAIMKTALETVVVSRFEMSAVCAAVRAWQRVRATALVML